jgi:hypothetical protein
MATNPKKWDAFLSHAFEDQTAFVRPLAEALAKLGADVWFSEWSLKLGDSLSRSIDNGLINSRFGIVVLSPHFFRKAWPERELRGLVAKEISGQGGIIPVWHGVDHGDVVQFSPALADQMAVRTAGASAVEVALQILSRIRPDIYGRTEHAKLVKLATGDALLELQEELDSLKEELSDFQCPYCGARMATMQEVPVGPEGNDYDMFEVFECGQTRGGDRQETPCSRNPKFPKLDEYELIFIEPEAQEKHSQWRCDALPRTKNARGLHLRGGHGRSKEEAATDLKEAYAPLAGV